MSAPTNVTPIRPGAESPSTGSDTAIRALLSDIEFGTIGATGAIDALEKIENELATDVNDDNRGLYATLFLIREKLRSSIEEIEQACERARP